MRDPRARRLWTVLGVALAATVALATFPGTAPDDPRYAPSAPPQAGPSGQWNLLSTNDNVTATTGASGISADLAWPVTTGRPDVVIAILDSGIDYDHEDLRNKIWLNRGELPVPAGPCCTAPAGDPWDCNNDGVFNVRDYACDSRVTDFNGDGAVDRGDLRVFADGLDNDGDGYIDDISGWDADDNDGDEFDHRYFGHGTGRAGIVAPETNNAKGVAGICPRCPIMMARIDDTFVCSQEGVTRGAIFAVDHGARVINMSLGCTTASRMLRGAFDYATRKNVLAVNATANEFSFHQNFMTVFDDVMGIGGVLPNSRTGTTTWLQKASFSNYGAHLEVVAPTEMPGADMGRSGDLPNHAAYSTTAGGTSSATPHAAGVAGLVFSRAHDLIDASLLPTGGLALQDISAQEVRQILDRSAQDITPLDGTDYTVAIGWDRWTGYGRLDAKAAVDMVSATTIPPEADIDAPDWYTLVDGMVTVRFYANARWASSFGYTLEVGQGVEPLTFSPLASASALAANPALSSVDLASNFTASWNTAPLANGLWTLRLRVTDNRGNVGEDRMGVWVRHPDPQDHPGFPRQFDGSLETLSVALVDLDDDNRLETIFAGGNGEVHALRDDGTELPGFPVHTEVPPGLPLTTSPAFTQHLVPLSYESIIGGPAVADLDRDGQQEIVVAASDGKIYCWHADATVCSGFPAAADPGKSRDQYGTHQQITNNHPEGIGSAPALGDLDGDGRLEIVAGTIDQKLYVWHADGTRMAPFPIEVFDPVSSPTGVNDTAPVAIITSAAIADVDNDGQNEIVISTDETYASPQPPPGGVGGSGRAYVIKADGTIKSGWPVKPTSLSPSAVPLVAQGVVSSPVVADLDGNGTKEIALGCFLGDATIYNADGTTLRTLQGAFGGTGAGSDQEETTSEGGLARSSDQPSHFYVAQGAFADLDNDGHLDFLAGEVGNGLLTYATSQFVGSGPRIVFDHLLSAWDATTGTPKAAFPRVIEDWQFFNGPAVADIDGDGLPEAIESSGGYFVHAFNAAGLEPAGWPKTTGHWQTSTPSIGDLDGDGHVEVVQTTRLGKVFVWNTTGATCQPDNWRKFRHDEWNSGTYGTDTRRPARIVDLAAANAGGGDVLLTWTAVGDDGECGTATTYELRASAAPIDRTNFAGATPIAIPAPAAAGAAESRTVTPPGGATFFALRAVDEAGNAGPLATAALVPPTTTSTTTSSSSTSTTTVVTSTTTSTTTPTAPPLELLRVTMTHADASADRLTLKARTPALLAQLGMPGQDVTVTLSQNGTPRFQATVPASQLTPNKNGTKVRFRDSSGTIAGGITNLTMGGSRRTDIRLRARNLDLSSATAGPLTVRIDIGSSHELLASGTLRARGSRLVFP